MGVSDQDMAAGSSTRHGTGSGACPASNTRGRVVGLFRAASRGAPMRSLSRVQALAGQGLTGDRYALGCGTFSSRTPVVAGARALSLIDTADIARCALRLERSIDPASLRRNIVIEGLDLLACRGARFALGTAVIEIAGRCAPCGYLSRLLESDMQAGLYRGGGMRAAILVSGWIDSGDTLIRL